MPMRDRAEHLAWAKQRALEYLDAGDIANAVTSMGSDLGKHPETKPSQVLMLLGMRYVLDQDAAATRRWIKGFR
jgi:Tfp pilus assembly protein PilF